MSREKKERDPRVLPPNTRVVHIVQPNPDSDYLKFPELVTVQKNLDELESEIHRAFKRLDRDTIANFYIPFLGFLVQVTLHIQLEMAFFDPLYRNIPVPAVTRTDQKGAWALDRMTVTSPSARRHWKVSPQEAKDHVETTLWYTYFARAVSKVADRLLALFVLFESERVNWQKVTQKQLIRAMEETPVESAKELIRKIVQRDINSFSVQPHQWDQVVFVQLAKFLSLAIEKKYRRGKPPFFIYIDAKKFPNLLPKIFNADYWATGFHHRVIVPALALLTPPQVAQMWDYLLVVRRIYENKSIDHKVREEVFELTKQLLIENPGTHLDLCGGMGHFILWLRKRKVNNSSTLIDIAPKAVDHAQKRGIEAYVGNANAPIEIGKKFKVLTIMFAVQWLDATAYSNIIELLEPGGTLICNVYPAYEEVAQYYVSLLSSQGFTEVKYTEHPSPRGKSNFILSGKRPIELE